MQLYTDTSTNIDTYLRWKHSTEHGGVCLPLEFSFDLTKKSLKQEDWQATYCNFCLSILCVHIETAPQLIVRIATKAHPFTGSNYSTLHNASFQFWASLNCCKLIWTVKCVWWCKSVTETENRKKEDGFHARTRLSLTLTLTTQKY